MSLRQEELTPEQLALQEAYEGTWAYAQEALADPEFRRFLEESIERVSRSSAKPISSAEFRAEFESLFE